MNSRKQRIFLAGHRGMVGSALHRRLCTNESIELVIQGRAELDLTRQSEVEDFFRDSQFDSVYLAAARVGGILANRDFPADFIRENLQIQCNVIHAAHRAGVERLLFLGSSCIYPVRADQPMREGALMTGVLEQTNEAYAVAKIAGIKMCEAYRRQHGRDYRSVMPTNLYGPNDNFDLQSSHVLPALMRKFHDAVASGSDSVEVWGSGTPRREFLHVDDMADACIHVMNLDEEPFWAEASPHCSHLNIGCGQDVTIAELASLIAGITGFEGEVRYDTSRPDGAPRKLLDVSRLARLGWNARIGLEEGIKSTYEWMLEHSSSSR